MKILNSDEMKKVSGADLIIPSTIDGNPMYTRAIIPITISGTRSEVQGYYQINHALQTSINTLISNGVSPKEISKYLMNFHLGGDVVVSVNFS